VIGEDIAHRLRVTQAVLDGELTRVF